MSGEKSMKNIAADEYLWDRSGPVDADVARLEQLLAPLRYQPISPSARIGLPRRVHRRTQWAAAAILALAICGVWFAAMLQVDSDSAWTVVAIQGAPRVGSAPLAGEGRLRVGQWLETDSQSQAQLAIAGIGQVTVEPDSRLRLLGSHEKEQRLELARGRIEAFITAPPRLFFVETPSATAVDLGCRYNLSVDAAGNGVLEVTLGWVSFERGGQAAIVPYGAICRTRMGLGPGTPYYQDASPRLQRELERLDFENGGDAALDAVLAEAQERDALTLWHLLARVDRAQRERVFDRLSALSPPPPGILKPAILNGDPTSLRQWRDAFMWSPYSAGLNASDTRP